MKKSILIFILAIFFGCGGDQFDIHDAIESQNFEKTKKIIDDGIDLNSNKVCIPKQIEIWGGMCPMHHAVLTSNTSIMQLFLDNGADINKKALNKDEAPPLAWAIYFCIFDSVEWLVEKGANINYVDANGLGPLLTSRYSICETESEKEKMYKYLESKGAKE